MLLLEQFTLAVKYGGKKGKKLLSQTKMIKCVQIPALRLPGSLTWGKLFSLSELPFSHLENADDGYDDDDRSPSLVGYRRNGCHA